MKNTIILKNKWSILYFFREQSITNYKLFRRSFLNFDKYSWRKKITLNFTKTNVLGFEICKVFQKEKEYNVN